METIENYHALGNEQHPDIKDLIGAGKPFEPPFRRRGKNIKDKNLRTILQLKAYGTLNNIGELANTQKAGVVILEHMCELLNKEHNK